MTKLLLTIIAGSGAFLWRGWLAIRERWLGYRGQRAGDAGRWDVATRLLRGAVECAERVHGPEAVATARRLSHLGAAYRQQGRFREGAQVYLRALKIVRKQLDRDDPLVAAIYRSLDSLERAWARHTRGIALAAAPARRAHAS